MSGIRVLICDSISEKGVKMLSDAGFEVSYRPKITPEELLSTISSYDAVIVRSRTKVTREVVSAGKRLKAIGRAGVGLDNIDLKAAEEAGIKVYNTPDALTNAVAELVMGLMLSLARDIYRGVSGLKEGKWLKSSLMGEELKGKVLGVIGMGRIGRRVSEIAKAFGMIILFYDIIEIPRGVVKQLNLHYRELDELLAESDFVTLNIPLTPETRHYIDRKRLSKMKKTAYLINASRGAVVDEEALLNALKNGDIRGAALDVYEVEPPGRSELLSLSNVVCTPHIGAQTVEAQEEAATGVSERIIGHFKTGG